MRPQRAMPLDAEPRCAAPEHLELVDAAFQRPGGPDAHEMSKRLCKPCPVRRECFLLGNEMGEHGIWGGLSGKMRAQAGGRGPYGGGGNSINLRGVDHGIRKIPDE